MVLYDKKSNFLGIGQGELSMLGYEDMEEFKSYHDDFADLFVNRPGYISKFKNFSWIDYTLHSGVSNKNVVLRHKNGTEFEAKLNIMEIYLINSINEADSIYSIDINVAAPKNGFTTTTDPHLNKENIKLEPIFEEAEEDLAEEEPIAQEKTAIKDDFSLISDFAEEDYKKIDVDHAQPESYVKPISFKSEPEIKNDEFIFEAPKEDVDIVQKPITKLKVDMSDDVFDKADNNDIVAPREIFEPEEQEIKIKTQNNNDATNKEKHTDTEEISNFSDQDIELYDEDIDFTQIVEDTGMDLEDLAMFMDEFLNESKATSEKLHTNEDKQSMKNEILQLKGIASNLKMKNFTTILNLMFSSCGSEKFQGYLNKFDHEIKNLESQLS